MYKLKKYINRILFFLSPIFTLYSSLVFACADIDGLTDRNCDKQLVVVAFGDSITYGVGDFDSLGYAGRLKLIFPNIKIVKLGIRGEATSQGKLRSQRQLPLIPEVDYTIILQGTNDFWAPSRDVSVTKDNLVSIVKTARASGAETFLSTLTAIKPYKIRALQIPWVRSVNSNIKSFSQIDFFSLGVVIISSDNLHPSAFGHQQMALLAAKSLRERSLVNKLPDLDQDGIFDFAETKFGTNTKTKDSDGDGITDGDEVFKYSSNPLLTDTDGDGFSDDYEINNLKSDPTSALPGAPKLNNLEIIID